MMMAKLYNTIFGCWHGHYSFPITVRPGSDKRCAAAARTGTYVVCLDCGKEFPYDWEQMKMVTSHAEIRNPVPSFAPKEAA
jgi:hypothetical protein